MIPRHSAALRRRYPLAIPRMASSSIEIEKQRPPYGGRLSYRCPLLEGRTPQNHRLPNRVMPPHFAWRKDSRTGRKNPHRAAVLVETGGVFLQKRLRAALSSGNRW